MGFQIVAVDELVKEDASAEADLESVRQHPTGGKVSEAQMKIGYYPGCTLKSKALNLEKAAMAALDSLGVEYKELEKWNCCGAA